MSAEKTLEDRVKAGEKLTPEEEKSFLAEEGPVDGYVNGPVAEDMDPAAMDDEPSDNKPEDKPAEGTKPPASTDAPKKEEKQTPPADEKGEDLFVKLERELAKPEGNEDLSAFTDREKAYYHQMRRDRKKRQQAEADRDVLLREKKMKEQQPPVQKPPANKLLDELKKRDKTDFLTVEDVLALIDEPAPAAEPKDTQPPAKTEPDGAPQVDKVLLNYLRMADSEARTKHPEDYDYVMELTADLINDNEKALVAIATAMHNGENPAIKTYELIKSDPDFAKLYPAAQTRVDARKTKKSEDGNPPATTPKTPPPQKTPEQIAKEQAALKAQQALEKNNNQKKTTGHVDTSGSADGDANNLTMEQIAAMPDKEFRKLPKRVRDKYLQQFGA